jgi:hypothetical protein
MSILLANLKLYSPFQKQSWFYKYALFMQAVSILYMGMFVNKLITKKDAPIFIFMMPLIFTFVFGQTISMIQLNALSKPLSFCLPNNEKMPRRVIFIIGIIITVFYTFFASLFYKPDGLIFFILIIPTMTLASYFLGVCTSCNVTGDKKNQLIIMLLFLIASIFFFISVIFPNKFLISYNDAKLYFVLSLLFACILLIIDAWIMLGDQELKRKCFEKPFNLASKMPDAGSIDQLYLNNSRNNHKLSDFTDSNSRIALFFYKKMNTGQCFTVKHSLFGKLHYLFSRYFALNRNEPILKLILFSLLVILLGYLGNDSTQINSIFTVRPAQLAPIFIMCLFLSSIFAPSSHNQLLPEGRNLQYCISFLTWLVKYVILIFMTFIVIGASYFIRNIMPEVVLFDYHITYSNIGLNAILWALIINPVIDLMFSYVDIPQRLALMIMLTSGLFILSLIAFFTSNVAVHTVLLIIMILITNGLFVSLLIRHWLRIDHV